MSAPHVAVIGGGLCGSLAALVLRSRGLTPVVLDAGKRQLGGRFAGGFHADSGAQFLRASEAGTQWAGVLYQLSSAKLVAPWEGRFGLIGSRGGFLPREAIGSTAGSLGGMLKADEGAEHGADAGGVDFCGFLADADHPLLVGTPSNASVCASLCAGLEVVHGTTVTGMQFSNAGGGGGSGGGSWQLEAVGDGVDAVSGRSFNALVVASHDASLAAKAVRAAAAAAADADADVASRLEELSDKLQRQRKERTAACFTWSGYLPAGTSAAVPFDAATVPGSPILSFLARDASKPGRPDLRDLPATSAGESCHRRRLFALTRRQPAAPSLPPPRSAQPAPFNSRRP